ncbi:MAG: YdeI/OmpD-associated family protein [Rubrobacteraceae bacterium]
MANKTSKESTKVAKPALLSGGNTQVAKVDGNGPTVLRFEAQLFQRPKTKSDFQTLLEVPKWVSEQFTSHGSTKVEGAINGHPFRAALEPCTSRGHWLRVNKAMLKGALADAGDTVKLAILGPEPEPTVPDDLRDVLTISQEANTLWDDLTTMGRRDWVRWVESAKQPETRARRVLRTVEQLSSGKRRACCVNVYEYMLCRVRESGQTKKS